MLPSDVNDDRVPVQPSTRLTEDTVNEEGPHQLTSRKRFENAAHTALYASSDECLRSGDAQITPSSRRRARIAALYGEDAPLVPAKLISSDIRVVLVSDTHNVDIDPALFPTGDLLLHAGDHTREGSREELERASDWLRRIASRYEHGCVTIGGNHDLPLDTESFLPWNANAGSSTRTEALACGKWKEEAIRTANADYFTGGKLLILSHEPISIAGLTIFGSPYVPLSPSKAKRFPVGHPARLLGFNRDDAALAEHYTKIPAHCDILMTHTPAFGLLDVSYQYGGVRRATPVHIGSQALHDWFAKSAPLHRPVLHVFGHEHDSRGVFVDEKLGMHFVNAAAVNGDRGVLHNGGSYTLKAHFRAVVVDFRLDS